MLFLTVVFSQNQAASKEGMFQSKIKVMDGSTILSFPFDDLPHETFEDSICDRMLVILSIM